MFIGLIPEICGSVVQLLNFNLTFTVCVFAISSVLYDTALVTLLSTWQHSSILLH